MKDQKSEGNAMSQQEIKLREEAVLKKLRNIAEPVSKKDIVTLKLIQDIQIHPAGINLTLICPSKNDAVNEQLIAIITVDLKALDWVKTVHINPVKKENQNIITQKPSPNLEKVKHIIAVSSCKGGVGKSTSAVNLAFAWAQAGKKVGLFDADIYGPSLPTMVGTKQRSLTVKGQYLCPIEFQGVKLMSFGYTQNYQTEDNPAILRGPIVSQIIHQLLTQTAWGDLDYLVIDMPPGTGDIQITLCQIIPLTASVIVTTPQHISFIDVVKGVNAFDSLKVPVIGVIENMSYFELPDKSRSYPFSKGALKRLQDEFGFENCLEIPIHEDLSASSDKGVPLTHAKTRHPISKHYYAFSNALDKELEKLKSGGISLPNVGYDNKKGILISYSESDQFHIPCKTLRLACTGAHTQDELTGEMKIRPEDIPSSIHPLSMNPVGNYALGVNWSDGTSSLYPYERLRQLAQ